MLVRCLMHSEVCKLVYSMLYIMHVFEKELNIYNHSLLYAVICPIVVCEFFLESLTVKENLCLQ